jgi:hypothetical protein
VQSSSSGPRARDARRLPLSAGCPPTMIPAREASSDDRLRPLSLPDSLSLSDPPPPAITTVEYQVTLECACFRMLPSLTDRLSIRKRDLVPACALNSPRGTRICPCNSVPTALVQITCGFLKNSISRRCRTQPEKHPYRDAQSKKQSLTGSRTRAFRVRGEYHSR